ncbi:hypothetical protein IV203_016696 [Nitzschia inconspicua]|uniref:Uncharacterized protein n=1 Tax=Nitzschia inconspicua TaxID=303405 RepID=A0A9K3KR16_9STRA|nr:hypothetical protein IV203_016696 [Nitzschia inconspicua]
MAPRKVTSGGNNKKKKIQQQQQTKTASVGKENGNTKTPSQRAMEDGKKLPIISTSDNQKSSGVSPNRSLSHRSYLRDSSGNTSQQSPSSPQRITTVTPWMTGGHMMRAPSKPTLTLPKNWTTRSGRFRPSEFGWGFTDARSTFGVITAGLSAVSGGGWSGRGGSRPPSSRNVQQQQNDGKDEEIIEDPEQQAKFYADLDDKGIKQIIVVDAEWETRSAISVVSMSDASYILDLAQQKQFRHNQRQEEALEEAFILYKVALAEGAVDDEQMFFMLLEETKKELDQKYAERDRKLDQMLDEALEAEIKRREKEKQRKLDHGSSQTNDNQENFDSDNAISTHQIAEEEYYNEVMKTTSETLTKLKGDDESKPTLPESQKQSLDVTRSDNTHPESDETASPKKSSPGLFSCCGRDVENSVVVSNKPTMGELVSKSLQQRDPAYFKKLRRQQEEEKKKLQQMELTDEDKWWQNDTVKVDVPDVEEDMPSKKSNESFNTSSELGSDSVRRRKSSSTTSFQGNPSPRRNSKSTKSSSAFNMETSEDDPKSTGSNIDDPNSPEKSSIPRRVSDSSLSSNHISTESQTLSDDNFSPPQRTVSKKIKKRASSLTPNDAPKRKKSTKKSKSTTELGSTSGGIDPTTPVIKGKKKKNGKALPGTDEKSPKKVTKKKSIDKLSNISSKRDASCKKIDVKCHDRGTIEGKEEPRKKDKKSVTKEKKKRSDNAESNKSGKNKPSH